MDPMTNLRFIKGDINEVGWLELGIDTVFQCDSVFTTEVLMKEAKKYNNTSQADVIVSGQDDLQAFGLKVTKSTPSLATWEAMKEMGVRQKLHSWARSPREVPGTALFGRNANEADPFRSMEMLQAFSRRTTVRTHGRPLVLSLSDGTQFAQAVLERDDLQVRNLSLVTLKHFMVTVVAGTMEITILEMQVISTGC